MSPFANNALEILIDKLRDLLSDSQRRSQAFLIRFDAAFRERLLPAPEHPNNGDECLYPNKIGNFSKGLPHHDTGEVDLEAYEAFIHALTTGDPADFEKIPLGGDRKLVNPQAGLAFDLEGPDSHELSIPAAPAFASAEEAGEIIENYWMALTRDVDFSNYASDPRIKAAAEDLSKLSDFRGPKIGGKVTPETLFRGNTFHRDPASGEIVNSALIGPYLSQFLWRPAPFGAQYVEQRMRTVKAGTDYMTTYEDWLNVQRGITPAQKDQFQETRRYIINGRDLGQWVHIDVLYQAYFNACLILLKPKTDDFFSSGLGAKLNPGNPYNTLKKQVGFGTFGDPYIIGLLTEVATRALKAVWYQKWFVHRRLRPEAYGGRIHRALADNVDYPFHPDLRQAAVLDKAFEHGVFKYNERLNQGKGGTYLLPIAFPEGSPIHPAYGAGHATVAGACVTILKALFDEAQVIPKAMLMVPDPSDASELVPYTGADAGKMTIGGELNKLATNIAIGRNIAGVHWRSDATASLKLGEDVAIGILKDQRATFNEEFHGFTFTKFNGETITV